MSKKRMIATQAGLRYNCAPNMGHDHVKSTIYAGDWASSSNFSYRSCVIGTNQTKNLRFRSVCDMRGTGYATGHVSILEFLVRMRICMKLLILICCFMLGSYTLLSSG
jgi:hypothetical protein